jgi:uncharacterized membrane protein YqjE
MSTAAPKGLFESIKSLVDRVVTLLHGRVELFTTELQEELARLIGVVMWAMVAALTAIIGTSFLAVMTLLFVPASYRGWAALVIAVFFLGVATIGALTIRKIVRAKPRPFDASLNELEKDRARLRGDR